MSGFSRCLTLFWGLYGDEYGPKLNRLLMWIVQQLENSCISFWKVLAVVDSHVQEAEFTGILIHSLIIPPHNHRFKYW